MASSLPLEDNLGNAEIGNEFTIDEEIRDEVYSPGKASFLWRLFSVKRARAAGEFALDVVKANQEVINKGVAYYLCYLTAINSFVYSFISLKYSSESEGYIFQNDFGKNSLELRVFSEPGKQ